MTLATGVMLIIVGSPIVINFEDIAIPYVTLATLALIAVAITNRNRSPASNADGLSQIITGMGIGLGLSLLVFFGAFAALFALCLAGVIR